MTPSRPTAGTAELDAMIEEATVDCYDEGEQVTGLFIMLEENLVVPFTTAVLGMSVTVETVELAHSGQIVAICAREDIRQAIPITDLLIPTPPPKGAEWIEAYRRSMR